MKQITALLMLLLLCTFTVSAEKNTDTDNYSKPENLIGLSPDKIFEILGPPDEIYPLRGNNHWQDNVVFFYDTSFYLFWFQNRVWQIRADYRHEGELLGVKPGLSVNETREILGEPFYKAENEDIFLNPGGITRLETGFPLRMRILYSLENIISDIYLFRGDY